MKRNREYLNRWLVAKNVMKKSRGIWITNKAFLLVISGLLVFLFFNLYPIAYSVYLAFTNANFYNIMGKYSVIGLENFRKIFFHPNTKFYYSLGRTALFVIISVPLKVTFGIALAVLLNSAIIRGRAIFRSLLILPWTLPAVLSILMWRGLFNMDFGAINKILMSIGFPAINWLNDTMNAFIAYNIVEVWLAYPFMMTVILAALQSIPPELYDSAQIDGAGRLQRLRYVTLPLIFRPLWFATILTSNASFQAFLVPYLLNGGGPARTNEFVILFGYKEAFQIGEFGYAAAFMVIISLVIMAFMFIGMKAGRMTGEG